MDKGGATKSTQQSKQSMASMQQKGTALPHQPYAQQLQQQQQPNYNVSPSMGWGQSMGMQNPGMGYGMMPMYPMYGQYGMQPGMMNTGYGMNPGMQFQKPQ